MIQDSTGGLTSSSSMLRVAHVTPWSNWASPQMFSSREGALRPTVANAMVRIAGEPSGILLDPCCGSGTILGEAVAAGWEVRGSDIDPDAVQIARKNVPGISIWTGDARRLEVEDGSVSV